MKDLVKELQKAVDMLGAENVSVVVHSSDDDMKCSFEVGPADNRWKVYYSLDESVEITKARLMRVKELMDYAVENGLVVKKEPKAVKKGGAEDVLP